MENEKKLFTVTISFTAEAEIEAPDNMRGVDIKDYFEHYFLNNINYDTFLQCYTVKDIGDNHSNLFVYGYADDGSPELIEDTIIASFDAKFQTNIFAESKEEAVKIAEDLYLDTPFADFKGFKEAPEGINDKNVSEVKDEFKKILWLPSGSNVTLDGRYGVKYNILKSPEWDGKLESETNQIQITAFYNDKCIATVNKEAWVMNEHFNLKKILDGLESMQGVTYAHSCPVEELRAMGHNFDKSPESLLTEFLDLTGFSLGKASDPDAPHPNEGEIGGWYISDDQEGWEHIGNERFDSAYSLMSRLDSCFTEYILYDLAAEVEEYGINDIIDTSDFNSDDWAKFFKENDNYECFFDLKRKPVYLFIQDHRFELSLCELYSEEKCNKIDLNKVYNLMYGDDGSRKDTDRKEKETWKKEG